MLKRRVDKSNASAFRGAELKKLAQESYCGVYLAFGLLLVATYCASKDSFSPSLSS